MERNVTTKLLVSTRINDKDFSVLELTNQFGHKQWNVTYQDAFRNGNVGIFDDGVLALRRYQKYIEMEIKQTYQDVKRTMAEIETNKEEWK